jgi:hypothetical protein
MKITDFGLAVDVKEERAVTRLGTLDYMVRAAPPTPLGINIGGWVGTVVALLAGVPVASPVASPPPVRPPPSPNSSLPPSTCIHPLTLSLSRLPSPLSPTRSPSLSRLPSPLLSHPGARGAALPTTTETPTYPPSPCPPPCCHLWHRRPRCCAARTRTCRTTTRTAPSSRTASRCVHACCARARV